MTTHPCSGHWATCDHCYRCDVLGECCASVSTGGTVPVQLTTKPTDLDRLREAIATDQADQPSLSDLIQADADRSFIRRVLDSIPEPAPVPLVPKPSAPRQSVPAAPALERPVPPALPPASLTPTDLLTQQQPTNRKEAT